MRVFKRPANFFLLALPRRERMKVRVVILRRTLTPALSHVVGEGVVVSPVLDLIYVLLLCAWVFLPTPLIAADLHSLTVLSYPDRPAKLPLWLAQDAGLFEKHGLKVEIKAPKSGEDLVERIGRDEAQIYVATANWIVSGIGDGKDLVFFATPVTACSSSWLGRRSLDRKTSEEKKSARESSTAARIGLR